MLLKSLLLPAALAVEFPKDGDTDKHTFPPEGFLGASSGMPYGHLRPIGHQRRTLGEIDNDELSDLSQKDIYNNYISKDKPVLLKNYLELSKNPNFNDWNDDEYFPTNFREMVVETVAKMPGKYGSTKPLPMRIGKFIDFYKSEDWYLISTIPEKLEKKTPLPKFLNCGPFPKVVEESKLWFSYGMTSSHIHKDHQETLLCLLDGRKDVIFIEPDQAKLLKDFSIVDDVMGYTRLKTDSDHINMFTEAAIGRIGWRHATVRGGDCLYIPANAFHHIRSHGRALGISYHWEPLVLNDADEAFEECSSGKETESKKYNFLTDLNLKYRANERGVRYIDLDYYHDDLEAFREDLKLIAYGNGYIEQEDFYKMWQLWAYNNSPEDYMRIAWAKIAQSMQSTKASLSKIDALTRDDLSSLFKLLKRFYMKAVDPVGFREMHDEL